MRALRTAAAFLLSAHAIGMAELSVSGGLSGAGMIATIVAAMLSLLGEGPSSERLQRDRAATYRLGSLWSIYALYLITAFMMASSRDRSFADVLVGIVVLMQLVFLAWPSIGPRAVPLLVNALGLCLLAGPAGGFLPSLAVAGYAPLAAMLIVVDHHHLRRAQPRDALTPAAAHAGLAALVVWPLLAWLPRTAPGQGANVPAAPELGWSVLGEATVELVVAAALGLGLILLARWLLKRLLGESEESLPDELEPAAEAGRSQGLSPGLDPLVLDLSGARGEIIRIFERFLASAGKLGFERRPHWTASEFARRLPMPASRLARLFGRARYSEEELLDADAAEAAAAAEQVLERLRQA